MPDPSVPAAGHYRLDPAASTITFRTRHLFGAAAVSGTFAVLDGEITVDLPHATVSATVDAASFRSGNRLRDRVVRSARFLDADKHARFVFRSEALAGASLTGDLSVRDTTCPITLAIESVEPAGGGFHARATTRVDRYAFGVDGSKGMAARWLDLELDVAAVAHI